MSLTTRTFRLFLSSTFSDFQQEREALQNKVFPKLERFCADNGARFQAVDLRWGITEEAQQEHDTMRICMEEVRRCQQLSPRPNFAVLLGARYGWEPVPARIPHDHWARLMKHASPEGRALIEDTYRLDENAMPSVYCLRKRSRDLNREYKRETQLLQTLRYAARSFRGKNRLPYFASATHQEIWLGAMAAHDAAEHVHVYERRIQGLRLEKRFKDYIDWDDSADQPTKGAYERVKSLACELQSKLPGRVRGLGTRITQGKVSKPYLERFCKHFLADQMAIIRRELDAQARAKSTEFDERERAHTEFAQERGRIFEGRQQLLGRLARYMNPGKGRSVAPLVLIGTGGSGKSALLAKAVEIERRAAKTSKAVVIARFIGGVPGAESLMGLIGKITGDLAQRYGQPQPPTPENAKELAQSFEAALDYASTERPLHLFLDALDQLDSADNAWMLEWLPKVLPPPVRIVASVRSGNVEQMARRRFSVVEVPAMTQSEGAGMLKALLADKRAAWFNAGIAPSTGRRLTKPQQQAVHLAFKATGSALWLKLAYEEVSTWHSWKEPEKLPTTVKGLIERMINQRLIHDENHSKVFTQRALGYLSAGRVGLSEDELALTLGTDVDVRAEFNAIEKTQLKWDDPQLLPPILWSRLFFDLQPYIGLTRVDGALLMRWFHREFKEVVAGLYLATHEAKDAIHGNLAKTFLDLDRALRPGEINDDVLFRATDAGSNQSSAALRRVTEQPWQLDQAGRKTELEALLTDFGFCVGKCAAGYVEDLERDLEAAHLDDAARFLRMNLHLLRSDLAGQDWPRHRVLVQLALEESPPKTFGKAATTWFGKGVADWDVAVGSSLVNRASSIQVRPPHTVPLLSVFLDKFGRLLVRDCEDATEAFDAVTGSPLGSTDFTEEPGGVYEKTDSLLKGDGRGSLWPVGNGRWFRWQDRRDGGESDGSASLYEPAVREWAPLLRMHHHEVWIATALKDGAFASLGLNATIGTFVFWPFNGKPEAITLDAGPGQKSKSCGIVQLPDDSILVWPAWNDGMAIRLHRGASFREWKGYPLYGTEQMRGAIPCGKSRFVTWTASGEVRLWKTDDLDQPLQLKASRYPQPLRSQPGLKRSSARHWDSLAGKRSVTQLYRLPDGAVLAKDDSEHQGASHKNYWTWRESIGETVEFMGESSPPQDSPPMQSAGSIEDLLGPWSTWEHALAEVLDVARKSCPPVVRQGAKSTTFHDEPEENEGDIDVWIRWLFYLRDDGQKDDKHFGAQRRRDLIDRALNAIERLSPHNEVAAFLQSDALWKSIESFDSVASIPLRRVLDIKPADESLQLAWIALCEKRSRHYAITECERLCAAHPDCWRLTLRLALLLEDQFSQQSTSLLIRASRMRSCPPLVRRLPSENGFAVWEFVVDGRRSLWVCGHPVPNQMFVSGRCLLLTGRIADGVRTLQMIGGPSTAPAI